MRTPLGADYTWSIFNPGIELSPVYRVEISALSVIQNSQFNSILFNKIKYIKIEIP
jgi:hypothetical protein